MGIGALGFINGALSFVGKVNNDKQGNKLFSNGRKERWCADFVTYHLKKAGITWLGSPAVSTLRSQAISKGKYMRTENMNEKAKSLFIAKNVKPGDIMIEKRNGKSHTGIVTSVNAKTGSFTTVEGNSGDKVAKRSYQSNSKTLSGFIKMFR